jgi:NifU-like protein
MSVIQKFKEIDKVLDEQIRPMLVMDGGNMEVIDVKEDGENIDVYIRYLGACSGCASGATGTLFAIESVLQEKLYPNIRVLPV